MIHPYAQLCVSDFRSRDAVEEPTKRELDNEGPLIRCWHCGELKALRFANDVCDACKEDWRELP